MGDLSSIVTMIAASVATATFCWRVRQSWKTEKSRQQALVNAAYHHVETAIGLMENTELAARHAEVRETIETNPGYTPYILNSVDDDLTYAHVIGVMEWLDDAGEKAIAKYFYAQSTLSAFAESFKSEYIQSWSAERKLVLFDLYIKQVEKTLASAKEARDALKTVKGEATR